MDKIKFTNQLLRSALLSIGITAALPTFAATPVDLSHQTVSSLSSIHDVQEVSRSVGVNGTTHIRIQQYYKQAPVFEGDAIIHIANAKRLGDLATTIKTSKGTMNGTLYQGLDKDLTTAPATAQADKAIAKAIQLYQEKTPAATLISQKASELMVYVDEKSKAHFVYRVSFFAEVAAQNETPAMPTYLLDATTLTPYKSWDDLHKAKEKSAPVLSQVYGGGSGGNLKIGELFYDGLNGHLAPIRMSRDDAAGTCYLENESANIKMISPKELVSFPCKAKDPAHGYVYWNGQLGAMAGGYSPANDAMYNTNTVRSMFTNWYGEEVVLQYGKPVQLHMYYGYKMANAFYVNGVLSMGDGGFWYFHPWTTRDVIAHELSHGFTDKYSKLTFTGQSGAINEAFGDMTAKAVEVFVTGRNEWTFGSDVVSVKTEALRYFDQPSRDCQSKVKSDTCSIDHMSQYNSKLSAYQLAGIYNRAFYLWATASGWDTKKAYDVVLAANKHYWTSNTNFEQGACGIIRAAKDYSYPTSAITAAFDQVGVSTSSCQ